MESEESLNETWVSWGLLIKLPFKDIPSLIKYCKDKGYYYIYDKASLSKLKIQEISPSGTSYPEGYNDIEE